MFRQKSINVETEHQKLRSKQLCDFHRVHPHARSVPSSVGGPQDSHTFDIALQQDMQGEKPTLRVILPASFPERPPLCQLLYPSSNAISHTHRYLDSSSGTFHFPKFQSSQWHVHSCLGALVSELIALIQQQPPTHTFANKFTLNHQHIHDHQHNNTQALHSSTPPSSAAAPPPLPPRPSSNLSSAAPSRIQPPSIPASFPFLQDMNIYQLESLLPVDSPLRRHVCVGAVDSDCDSLLDPLAVAALRQQVLSKHDENWKHCKSLQTSIRDRCQQLIEENVSLDGDLSSMLSGVYSVKSLCEVSRSSVESLHAAQQSVSARFALSNATNKLNNQAQHADQAAEQTRAALQHASLPANDMLNLLEQYIKDRTLYHERNAKRERLLDMYGRR